MTKTKNKMKFDLNDIQTKAEFLDLLLQAQKQNKIGISQVFAHTLSCVLSSLVIDVFKHIYEGKKSFMGIYSENLNFPEIIKKSKKDIKDFRNKLFAHNVGREKKQYVKKWLDENWITKLKPICDESVLYFEKCENVYSCKDILKEEFEKIIDILNSSPKFKEYIF